MHKVILLCLALVCSPFIAQAQPRDVTSLPMHQCTVQQVISILTFESIRRAGIVAEQSLIVTTQLQAINSKAKRPNVPLQDQLSTADQVEFTRLSQQMAASMLAQLVESHRQRDLRVLEQLIRIADQEYRWQKTPNEGDQDYTPWIVLVVMREKLTDIDVTHPGQDRCTIEYALHQIELPILDALGKMTLIPDATAFLNHMAKKYPGGLDVKKMSKPDADLFVSWRQYLQPALLHRQFVQDIERIKIMARAADLNARSKAEDLTFAAGDIKKIGATLDHLIKHNQLDETTQTALRLWFAVNEQIPSDVTKMISGAPQQPIDTPLKNWTPDIKKLPQ